MTHIGISDDLKFELKRPGSTECIKSIDLKQFMTHEEIQFKKLGVQIIDPNVKEEKGFKSRDYQVFVSNKTYQQNYFRILNFSKIWDAKNAKEFNLVFKGVSTIHFLNHGSVEIWDLEDSPFLEGDALEINLRFLNEYDW